MRGTTKPAGFGIADGRSYCIFTRDRGIVDYSGLRYHMEQGGVGTRVGGCVAGACFVWILTPDHKCVTANRPIFDASPI